MALSVDLEIPVLGIIQDSRLAKSGSLFVAIRGHQSDGHQFIPEVLSKGAIALVDKAYPKISAGMIQVDSTREMMGKIGSRFWGRPTSQFQLVGVTGTNGKTTTTFLLDQIWNSMGLVTGLLGTVKNKIAGDVIEAQLTTPGALELQALFHRMAQRRVEVCAMEVSSIALDQFRTMGSRFQVGVFTNFTQDHLDYHQTMERYLEAKLKFFKDYELPCVVVNIDDEYSDRVLRVSSGARQLTFSLTQTSASFHVLECQFKKNGTSARIQTPRGEFEIKSPLIGAHNLQNILSVLAVVEGLGQDLTQAIKALETAPG
ncbi:MAG: Mur ligase family protein, partial [Deltaproteobacteria bacterium]